MSKISVILPVYNSEIYIAETIESILNQTFEDFELIILNDGSTDRSEEIIKSYQDKRIIYIYHDNMGLSKTLNKGIKHSKSNIIARIDSDDICLPNRFELQYNFLENNPDYVLIGTNVIFIDENGDTIYYGNQPLEDDKLIDILEHICPICHSSVMVRKSAILKFGGYDTVLNKHFEDYLLWYNIKKEGKLKILPEYLTKYRIRRDAITLKIANKTLDSIKKNVLHRGYALEEDVVLYERIIEKLALNKTDKDNQYYLLLAKKYTWNNPNKSKAIRNLNQIKTKKIKQKTIILILKAINYLIPSFLTKNIYKKITAKTRV